MLDIFNDVTLVAVSCNIFYLQRNCGYPLETNEYVLSSNYQT